MAQALRSTRVLTPDGLRPAALIIDGEKIAAIHTWNDVATAASLLDFGDLLILPGLVDSHVHINDPGRDWEGFDTATRAAAAGGVTTLVDMPLNCIPETINVPALDAKRNAAARTNMGGLGRVGRCRARQRRGTARLGASGRSGIQVLPDPLRHRRILLGERI